MIEHQEKATGLLDERGAEWFEAATIRRSRRSFDGRAISEKELVALTRVCRDFRPFGSARVEFVTEPATDVFRGAVGSYGKVTGAPHVLVMVAPDDAPGHVAAGYVGEAAVLEAAAIGLDTCWIGGFFDRARVEQLVTLQAGERALAVSPVGYAVRAYTGAERLMRGMARSHRRKPLAVLAPGLDDDWPSWARTAVECARLAPSAVNRQPWRFSFEEGALVLRKSDGPEYPTVTKDLDCGIAMLHAELGARVAGARATWHIAADDAELARLIPADAVAD